MDGGLIFLFAFLGIEIALVGGLVTYLLYRRQPPKPKPKPKSSLKPDGKVATTYGDPNDSNGHVLINVDDKRPNNVSPSNDSSASSSPDPKKKLLDSDSDVKIEIEPSAPPHPIVEEEEEVPPYSPPHTIVPMERSAFEEEIVPTNIRSQEEHPTPRPRQPREIEEHLAKDIDSSDACSNQSVPCKAVDEDVVIPIERQGDEERVPSPLYRRASSPSPESLTEEKRRPEIVAHQPDEEIVHDNVLNETAPPQIAPRLTGDKQHERKDSTSSSSSSSAEHSDDDHEKPLIPVEELPISDSRAPNEEEILHSSVVKETHAKQTRLSSSTSSEVAVIKKRSDHSSMEEVEILEDGPVALTSGDDNTVVDKHRSRVRRRVIRNKEIIEYIEEENIVIKKHKKVSNVTREETSSSSSSEEEQEELKVKKKKKKKVKRKKIQVSESSSSSSEASSSEEEIEVEENPKKKKSSRHMEVQTMQVPTSSTDEEVVKVKKIKKSKHKRIQATVASTSCSSSEKETEVIKERRQKSLRHMEVQTSKSPPSSSSEDDFKDKKVDKDLRHMEVQTSKGPTPISSSTEDEIKVEPMPILETTYRQMDLHPTSGVPAQRSRSFKKELTVEQTESKKITMRSMEVQTKAPSSSSSSSEDEKIVEKIERKETSLRHIEVQTSKLSSSSSSSSEDEKVVEIKTVRHVEVQATVSSSSSSSDEETKIAIVKRDPVSVRDVDIQVTPAKSYEERADISFEKKSEIVIQDVERSERRIEMQAPEDVEVWELTKTTWDKQNQTSRPPSSSSSSSEDEKIAKKKKESSDKQIQATKSPFTSSSDEEDRRVELLSIEKTDRRIMSSSSSYSEVFPRTRSVTDKETQASRSSSSASEETRRRYVTLASHTHHQKQEEDKTFSTEYYYDVTSKQQKTHVTKTLIERTMSPTRDVTHHHVVREIRESPTTSVTTMEIPTPNNDMSMMEVTLQPNYKDEEIEPIHEISTLEHSLPETKDLSVVEAEVEDHEVSTLEHSLPETKDLSVVEAEVEVHEVSTMEISTLEHSAPEPEHILSSMEVVLSPRPKEEVVELKLEEEPTIETSEFEHSAPEHETKFSTMNVVLSPKFKEKQFEFEVSEDKAEALSPSSDDEKELVVEEREEVVDAAVADFQETSVSSMYKDLDRDIDLDDDSSTERAISTATSTLTRDHVEEIVIEEPIVKSRKDIKFTSGWQRQVTLDDLLKAGIVTESTVEKLEHGTIEEAEVEKTLQKYLVGNDPIAGLLIEETGERMSIFEAFKQGLIRRGTSISLLEAQAATGRIIDPTTANKMSVKEAKQEKIIDRQFEAVLTRAEKAVFGYKSRGSDHNLSLFEAMNQGIVVQNHGIRLLEAQIATGGVIDPQANHRLPVEVAYDRGLFDENLHEILEDPSDDTRGFFDPNTEENLTYMELMQRCVTDKDTGLLLLPLKKKKQEEADVVQVPVEESVASDTAVVVQTENTLNRNEGSLASIGEDTQVVTLETSERSRSGRLTSTTTIVTTEELVTTEQSQKRKKSRHDIHFLSGWKRRVTLDDLFKAGVLAEETIEQLEEGEIEESVVAQSLEQYLVGAEPIAGLLMSNNGEKISIYDAWKKGLIRRGTSISLLEAQAATGRIIDPKTAERMSVSEASQKRVIDRQFEAVLTRAERAVYGYTTRLSKETISLFAAMKRGLVVENHGVRLLEAQIATGGIIDPRANHRLPVEVAFERGLFDERLHQILEDPSDDTRGFFDPNTEENLTYLELMERCVIDKDTGLRLLPLRVGRKRSPSKHAKVVFESATKRQVMLEDLLAADLLDQTTAQKFDEGLMTSEEVTAMVAKLKVYVDGTMPIAGIISATTGEKMSIVEASRGALIRKGTAFELLEAQAACGKLIDCQNGKSVTIETALSTGVIDSEFEDVVTRAHRAVVGYREPFKRDVLSLCDAMARHLVVERHAIRLLEAQIATGGMVDIKSPVRISVPVALKRGMLESSLARKLEKRETKSYFDPMTGENLNYSELMGRCVLDKDTNLLFLMVEGGTVTQNVRPFEPEPESKRIREKAAAKLTTEVVETKRRKRKSKKVKKERESESSSTSSIPSSPPAILSRRVVIVDPNTGEELTVREALKGKLIDRETANQLLAQEGDFVEDE